MSNLSSISSTFLKQQVGFNIGFNPAYEPVSRAPAFRGFYIPETLPFSDSKAENLSIKVLKSPVEKAQITHLRHYADCASEYELDPGLAEKESIKDEIGIVTAIYRNKKAIATIRFVPTGYDATLTERLWRNAGADPAIMGPDSVEVGRLIMAPEDRRADLLPKCLALALQELLKLGYVQNLHASCLTKMARLYRRFGFKTVATIQSKGGKDCALIHGTISEVAAALKVSMHEPNVQRNVALKFERLDADWPVPTLN